MTGTCMNTWAGQEHKTRCNKDWNLGDKGTCYRRPTKLKERLLGISAVPVIGWACVWGGCQSGCYLMLPLPAAASGQHCCCYCIILQTFSAETSLRDEAICRTIGHEVKGWPLGGQHPGCVPNSRT
jgi:hypothetical protein